MPPPPPQSSYLDVVPGVSIRLRMLIQDRLLHCTLDSLPGQGHRDQLDFDSSLRLIVTRTFHHTAYSLNDVHLHSSTSFSDNASVVQGMIDFHRDSLFPSISYHFSCKYLQSLGCRALHCLFNLLGCSDPLRDLDLESMADWKSHYCIYCRYHVYNCREANRVTVTISEQVGLAYCCWRSDQPAGHVRIRHSDALRISMHLLSHPSHFSQN